MFGLGSGTGRMLLPAAIVPLAASMLSQHELSLVNGLAVGIASGVAVWGLAYVLLSRGGK